MCVRYRYDAELKKRLKTVESIVGERDWEPPAVFANDQVVALRLAYAGADLRRRVKRAGGRWNPDRRVWELRHDQAVAAGLTAGIADDVGIHREMRASPPNHGWAPLIAVSQRRQL